MKRFFCEDAASVDQIVVIRDSDAKHIHKVLRMRAGDAITVFDGAGHDYEAQLLEISENNVRALLTKHLAGAQKSDVGIMLAQAMLKGKKMDRLIRQVTELGIARWIPFYSERSIPVLKKEKLPARQERWRLIVREALKQCRRSVLTEVDDVVSFDYMLSLGRSSDVRLIFWEEATRPLAEIAEERKETCRNIFVVVGPEGGFSKAEIEKAKARGFESAGLGPRILKAETATIAACALMQYIFGDLKHSS